MAKEKKDKFVEKIKKELKECKKDNPEDAHMRADVLLCDLLTHLGHQSVVDLFEDLEKWYA
jgi:hypothetical protein